MDQTAFPWLKAVLVFACLAGAVRAEDPSPRSRQAADDAAFQDPLPQDSVPPPPRPGIETGPSVKAVESKIRVDPNGRISLHIDDLDIRRALEVLSRQGGLNIMVSPGVTGRVTVNLENATVEQALSAILRLGNISSKREGGLIFVYSPAEFKQLAYQDQQIATRFYRLNYIRTTDLTVMLQNIISIDGTVTATPDSLEGISTSPISPGTAGGGGGGGGAVSPGSGGGGGGGGASTGGNNLAGGDVVVVRDYPQNLKLVDEIVARLDVPPAQVLVEALIMSIELDKNREFGINYAVVDKNGRDLGVIGNGSDLAANAAFTPGKLVTIPASATAAAIAAAGRLNGGAANNGINSDTNGIKAAFGGRHSQGFISALETLGDIRVLASPRLLVLNKQKAEIQLGERLGYTTVTQNFTSTVQQVQFLNTGTLLRLRPFISTDGMVRMEIHPERSSGTLVQGVPQANTSEVTTNVMVPDGATLVIGGLVENDDTYLQQGLPGLNRLPLVGAVLGQKNRSQVKRELIVMLTPHIWEAKGMDAPIVNGDSSYVADQARKTQARRDVTSRSSINLDPPKRESKTTRQDPQVARRSQQAERVDPAVVRSSATPLPSASGKSKHHVVQRGENFWTISRVYYGTGKYYKALWAANRNRAKAVDDLYVGTELVIPPVETLEVEPAARR